MKSIRVVKALMLTGAITTAMISSGVLAQDGDGTPVTGITGTNPPPGGQDDLPGQVAPTTIASPTAPAVTATSVPPTATPTGVPPTPTATAQSATPTQVSPTATPTSAPATVVATAPATPSGPNVGDSQTIVASGTSNANSSLAFALMGIGALVSGLLLLRRAR